jgi:hypothetical protein
LVLGVGNYIFNDANLIKKLQFLHFIKANVMLLGGSAALNVSRLLIMFALSLLGLIIFSILISNLNDSSIAWVPCAFGILFIGCLGSSRVWTNVIYNFKKTKSGSLDVTAAEIQNLTIRFLITIIVIGPVLKFTFQDKGSSQLYSDRSLTALTVLFVFLILLQYSRQPHVPVPCFSNPLHFIKISKKWMKKFLSFLDTITAMFHFMLAIVESIHISASLVATNLSIPSLTPIHIILLSRAFRMSWQYPITMAWDIIVWGYVVRFSGWVTTSYAYGDMWAVGVFVTGLVRGTIERMMKHISIFSIAIYTFVVTILKS